MRNTTFFALILGVGLFSIAGCGGDSTPDPNAEGNGGEAATDDGSSQGATDDATADSSAATDDNNSSNGAGGLSINTADDLDLDGGSKESGIGSDVELTIEEPVDSSGDDIFGSIDDDLGLGTPAKEETVDPAATDSTTADPGATEPDATEPDTPEPGTTQPDAEPDSGASAGFDPFGQAPAAAKPEMRTWTSATGNKTLEAVFVELKEGDVHLMMKDGAAKVIPLNAFSEADQDYVKEFVAAQGNTSDADDSPVEDSPE